jgi:hypothetical protein
VLKTSGGIKRKPMRQQNWSNSVQIISEDIQKKSSEIERKPTRRQN